MPLTPTPPARGVLSASAVDPADGQIRGGRALPTPALAPFIHHYWWVCWELRAPFVADTLPHPAGRIELEEQDGTWSMQISGVRTGRYAKQLLGAGQYFGVQFRPAALQPLLAGESMASLTDCTLPVARVLGDEANAWARAVQAERTLEAKVAQAEAFLKPRLHVMPPEVARMRDLVERIATDRSLRCVELLAERAGLDPRTLQRRFRRFVGVHPKWVIRRYRLLEAVAQLEAADPPKLSELASELGYTDQAHFQRDFKLVTGQTPGSFARHEPIAPLASIEPLCGD